MAPLLANGEDLSIQKSGRDLVVTTSPSVPHPGDTLWMWKTGKKDDRLELRNTGLLPGLTAVLVDRYLKKEMPVPLTKVITSGFDTLQVKSSASGGEEKAIQGNR